MALMARIYHSYRLDLTKETGNRNRITIAPCSVNPGRYASDSGFRSSISPPPPGPCPPYHALKLAPCMCKPPSIPRVPAQDGSCGDIQTTLTTPAPKNPISQQGPELTTQARTPLHGPIPTDTGREVARGFRHMTATWPRVDYSGIISRCGRPRNVKSTCLEPCVAWPGDPTGQALRAARAAGAQFSGPRHWPWATSHLFGGAGLGAPRGG